MQNPYVSIKTVPCDCDDIVFQVDIIFDENDQQSVEIKSGELLPLLGQVVGMLIAHRKEVKNLENTDINEVDTLLGGEPITDA